MAWARSRIRTRCERDFVMYTSHDSDAAFGLMLDESQ